MVVLTVGNNVGLEDLSNYEFKVHPNPATSSITISSESNLVGRNFTITNQLGQVVVSGQIAQQEMVVDLSNLSVGMYLININGENQSSFRIVKD